MWGPVPIDDASRPARPVAKGPPVVLSDGVRPGSNRGAVLGTVIPPPPLLQVRPQTPDTPRQTEVLCEGHTGTTDTVDRPTTAPVVRDGVGEAVADVEGIGTPVEGPQKTTGPGKEETQDPVG